MLAVDIPSGVDGLTGAASGAPLAAERTVTFAALKPGLLLRRRRQARRAQSTSPTSGSTCRGATVHRRRGAATSRGWWRPTGRDDHKWKRAVRVVAGSPGMTGAAELCSAAAMRAGAGIVWLSSPGAGRDDGRHRGRRPRSCLPAGWATAALDDLERFGSLVVGPGLGRDATTAADVVALLAASDVPAIVDGDGLVALAASPGGREAVRSRSRRRSC